MFKIQILLVALIGLTHSISSARFIDDDGANKSTQNEEAPAVDEADLSEMVQCSASSTATENSCAETENKFSECMKNGAVTKAMAMAVQKGEGTTDIFQTLTSTSQTLATCAQNISSFIKSCQSSAQKCAQTCTSENTALSSAAATIPAAQLKVNDNLDSMKKCASVSKNSIDRNSKLLADISGLASVVAVALPILQGMFANKDNKSTTPATAPTVTPFNAPNPGAQSLTGGNKNVGGSTLGGPGSGAGSDAEQKQEQGGKNPQQLAQFGQGGSGGMASKSSSGGGQGLADSYQFEGDKNSIDGAKGVFSDSFSSGGGGGRARGAAAGTDGSGKSSALWGQQRAQMQRGIASLTSRKQAEISDAHGLSNFDKVRRRFKLLEPTLQK